MSLPKAGVKSDFRRFEELTYYFNKALNELGEVDNISLGTTTFVEAINSLTSYYMDLSTRVFEKTKRNGVIFGLEVEAQTVPDMTVKVMYGVAYDSLDTRHSTDEVPVLAITAADAANPRIDVVYLDQYGVMGVEAGTPAAQPTAPTKPEYSVLLAEVAVGALVTKIEAANITDKRTILP